MRKFVQGYFAGSKDYNPENIEVIDLKVYKDPKEWLSEIRNWKTFDYLRIINNFAGDLLIKYFPDEIK